MFLNFNTADYWSKVLFTDKCIEFGYVTVGNCCLIGFNVTTTVPFLKTISFREKSSFKHVFFNH